MMDHDPTNPFSLQEQNVTEFRDIQGVRSPSETAIRLAYSIIKRYIDMGCRFVVGKYVYAEDMKKDIARVIDEARRTALEEAAKKADEVTLRAALNAQEIRRRYPGLNFDKLAGQRHAALEIAAAIRLLGGMK